MAKDSGAKTLIRLKETYPPSLLVPNPTLSETARAASKYLFSSLRPFTPKSPLDQLLVEGYDTEQIWHQINLQSQPLLSTIRRQLNRLIKTAEGIGQRKLPLDVANKTAPNNQNQREEEIDYLYEELDEADKDKEGSGIEDKILKIDVLTDYLRKEEQKIKTASTHEKQMEKVGSKIKLMEKANIEPKTWTMLGEVTASQRPVNSALEVDIEFEHNVRPALVITDEMNASMEEMIKKRIIEGRFDDVKRAPKLPLKVPREVKELASLDHNKSKYGLAEIYEQEYVQKIDPTSAPLSHRDKLKNEIAPMAISDAAMLAPEEVFHGKGDVKEDAELTRAERKRRRANKKRKFKGMIH
ncbi:hypothetical protein KIW84_041858 [Lathyrus oleraceus]|uniref:Uncharacterized protein n=1 Tax=Pisum sativum TaxID=3888 RepID=A0A9D4XBA0_PEA|nr:hypothetical protein KIW84_041858 [Pisum sativum]